MAHFNVMVVGEDHEAQLAPYHDFECTGINDKYVEDENITYEIRELMEEDYQHEDDPLWAALSSYDLEDRIVSDVAEVDLDGEHKYGYAVVKDGDLICAVIRTNPDKRWDWYEVGGRWTGMLKLKPGKQGVLGTSSIMHSQAADAHVDQARKGDVDWLGMRAHAAEKAEAYWDQVHAIAPDGWSSWDEVLKLYPQDIEGARNFYFSQKGIQDIQNSNLFGDMGLVDDQALMSREDYSQAAQNAAVMTFAVVKDGEWFSSEDMSDPEWQVWLHEMIHGLADDTLITIVDCHM